MAAAASAGLATAQDECVNAVNLPLGVATPFNNIGSTTSAPAWPCAAGGSDIWYRITAASAGALAIDTCGSSYDTALEVFSGTCAGLTSLGCNDDSCGLQSTLAVPVTAGTYYLRIGGFAANQGSGTVTANLLPPLSNDECSTAANLPLGVATPFSNIGATTSAPAWPCASGGSDIWFSINATMAGALVVDTCGSAYDTAIEVFSGTCAGLVPLGCNDDACGLQSQLAVSVTPGTYYLRIGGFVGSQGTGSVIASVLPPVANDECSTAIAVLVNTPVGFDNLSATTGSELFPCGFGGVPGGNDIWFRYTATSNEDIIASLCGSSFDTIIQAWSGTCGSLMSVGCNDDSCGLQSSVQFSGTTGQTYYIQVGGWNNAVGVGTLTVVETTPPPPCNGGIATLPYTGGNFGDLGGALYFDLTVSAAVSLGGMRTNFTAGAGTPVGISVYTAPMTYVGNEGNIAAWTLVAMDNGAALAAGEFAPTSITFASALNLSPGTYGIALVASPTTAHSYTNGDGTNQNFTSGVFSISAGAATNVPFTLPIFTPRVWNGQFCEGGAGAPGTNYCTANPNSTGQTGLMSGSGSASVAANNLTIEASRLPNNAFAYFLTSATQAVTPNPGGSLGILCLGGQIGRYTGPGQIQNSGGTGSVSLLLNLNQIPTPTGFVQAVVGQTRSFQCWHRDSVAGAAVSNFTDGYAVTFQ